MALIVGSRQCRSSSAGVGVGPAVCSRCRFSGVNKSHVKDNRVRVWLCALLRGPAPFGCQIDTLLLELLEYLCLVCGAK